ncbi:hypothetical protein GWK08_09505 [Leptobacterium flavescens]|uniref:Uncharacterized protein n=1 Tax=Leptobacterium flavescens TaxID=472055 RepID=A0A6P0US25_9FLAO|nr:hypothetical protein [Leptobacterium flavescens]NER13673.1 hypothetical protein [Leptobacterium flavescens]
MEKRSNIRSVLIKYLVGFLSFCYLMSPFQVQLAGFMHTLDHALVSYGEFQESHSHAFMDPRERLAHSAESFEGDHSHSFLTFFSSLSADENSKGDQTIPEFKPDKHIVNNSLIFNVFYEDLQKHISVHMAQSPPEAYLEEIFPPPENPSFTNL